MHPLQLRFQPLHLYRIPPFQRFKLRLHNRYVPRSLALLGYNVPRPLLYLHQRNPCSAPSFRHPYTGVDPNAAASARVLTAQAVGGTAAAAARMAASGPIGAYRQLVAHAVSTSRTKLLVAHGCHHSGRAAVGSAAAR